MADNESLDEILSSATSAATPEPAPAEPITEQQPANDGTARDEHGRFVPKAPEQPAATAQQPNAATPEPEGNGTVPQQALHEAREGLRAERARADRLEQAILALQKPAQPAPEPAKPVELWDNPDEWADNRLAARLTPLEKALSEQKLGFSRMFAIKDDGKEALEAANVALGELAQSNRAEAERIAQKMHQSQHPYGELITWHKAQQAQARIGNDPDAFVQSEIDRIAGDPAAKAALIARLTGAPAPVAGQTPASVTPNIPRSIHRLPGGTAEPQTGDESLDDILKSGRRRG